MVHARPNDKWDRSRRIDWLDVNALRRARCLVVGAGAIGNETVKNLALSGIGHITVIDMDSVELSNMNRCLFFRARDKGKPKTDVVAQGARELVPESEIRALNGVVEETEIDWNSYDVVLGCLDNIKARLHVNAHCRYHRVPYVDAGTDGMRAKLQVVLEDGPCIQCTMNNSHYRVMERRFSCTGGDFSYYEPPMAAEITTTAVIAALQVREVLKILSGKENACIHNVMFYDGFSNDLLELEVEIDEKCPNH